MRINELLLNKCCVRLFNHFQKKLKSYYLPVMHSAHRQR